MFWVFALRSKPLFRWTTERLAVLLVALAGLALLSPGCVKPSTGGPEPTSEITVLASGLEIPWSMDFLPGGDILFTERPGRIRMIHEGKLVPEPAATIDVAAVGESGLLGIAVDPDFASNRFIYVYYTYFSAPDNRTMLNRVSRFVLAGGKASGEKVILDGIPGGLGDQGYHNGGRIRFGPDGKLYVTTGDGGVPENAQDQGSLGGKILRIEKDGSIPPGNPFPGSPVYSMGHRNPQGLAWWHPASGGGQPETGNWKLYASEHGPSGNDELNLITPGKNYLWPTKQCTDKEDPAVLCFTETIAPSGMSFYGDKLYLSGLRGTQVREITFDPAGEEVLSQQVFLIGYGRIRDVVVKDKLMYVLTSNRDGRSVWSGGLPSSDDDRILLIRLG